MSKKVEVTNVEQDFIDSHEGFTREQVFEYPTTPLLMKIYLEDKYMIFKNPDVNFDEIKRKVKDNCADGLYIICKNRKYFEYELSNVYFIGGLKNEDI